MTKTISYTLFGLGALTILFFRNYSGDVIPYPNLIYLIGIAFFIIGIIILRKIPSNKQKQEFEKIKAEIQNLKTNGIKINVDLLKCSIKENHYFEEKDKYGSENYITTFELERNIQAVNILFGNSIDNSEKVQVLQTVLIYSANLNRETTTFISRTLPFDRINLLFKFEKQKETVLYVDKKDSKNYYFDLDFLDE